MAILTQRRITDLVSELDMLGLIHARVKSFGRGGRTKEIQLSVPLSEGRRILEEDEILNQLKNYKLRYQTTLM
jgi:cell division control protein 6